jgi:hypothetical protein
MATLKITYINNRTESVHFKTLWAANIKAQDWMAQNPNITVIEMLDNGILHTTFRRKG